MCESSSKTGHENQATAPASDGLTIRVADMTCGHCAATIAKAIETGAPGAKVHADPASKLVSVSGVADLAALQALVSKAGYTPTPV